MKLIVGLGNPGDEYKKTRHNIGFIVLDYYFNTVGWENNDLKSITKESANKIMNIEENLSSWKRKFNAIYKDFQIDNEKIIFVKPETYMNLSGNAVIKFVQFFKIEPKNILVIHDDLDLPFGKIRLKFDSSSGGHNGIKSIINNLGTQKFGRLKIGISHNTNGNTKDYVLGNFSKEEQTKLEAVLSETNEIINDFIKYDINKTIDNWNRKLK